MDRNTPKRPMSTAYLFNDDDGDDDGDRPKPRKGKKVAGGLKGPVPPALLRHMRARKPKE